MPVKFKQNKTDEANSSFSKCIEIFYTWINEARQNHDSVQDVMVYIAAVTGPLRQHTKKSAATRPNSNGLRCFAPGPEHNAIPNVPLPNTPIKNMHPYKLIR